MAIRCCALLLSVLCFTPPLQADLWDPPAGYYDAATGTGATLKSQLRTIMSNGQNLRTYGDFRYSARYHDADPDNPGNILLVYTRASVPADWDAGSTWAREHIWPQSRQPGDADNGETGSLADPHALRPINPSVNSSRSNKPFGGATTTGSNRSLGTYYFPGDADKGDVARSLFYSATRYASSGLTLVHGLPSGNQMGDLTALMHWHYLDTPDEFERRRNHVIYSSAYNPYYTNNRNAYIDRPEYAWSVFMDQQNDTRLWVGDGPATDGSSSMALDFGRVLVGAAMPDAQSVTLHKGGEDGTYYEVTTAGAASSSVTGRYNAFAMGSAGARTLDIGVTGDTATAGRREGQVTIDNLDVTLEGGNGRGARDGDDTITVTLDVLDHANGSFATGDDIDLLRLDFGQITEGDTAALNFEIANLVGTAGFTAGLVIEDVIGSGAGVFSTDLAATFIAAGETAGFTAWFDADTVGSYAAAFDILIADEDLPGAQSLGAMRLELIGEVIAVPEPAVLPALLSMLLLARRRGRTSSDVSR